MNLHQRIDAFDQLGQLLKNLSEEDINSLSLNARNQNSWFTLESVKSALKGIIHFLNRNTLESWIADYAVAPSPKKVGVIMAGNIPLVGFHDLLSVLISGHQLVAKLSSQDSYLMSYICDKLIKINDQFEQRIDLVDKLTNIDAVIATGSNNTSRYFEYYFSKYPHIIRKNRTSVAILKGTESEKELKKLGSDIFQYFGLGCRNVSKVYVPADYDFTDFFEAIESFKKVKDHHKYNNNYDYNKSIYLVNGEKHLDNGFLLIKQDTNLVSPISVIFYEQYANENELESILDKNKEMIQCIVSSGAEWKKSFEFGQAQTPSISDYADGVDTMKFLREL